MIIRAEQLPEIKEFLVGFQCTTGSLLSARWLQSSLHQALLLDCIYSSGGILLSWCLLITIPLALRSWSSRSPWLLSKPLVALAWPLAAPEGSSGYRDQGWGLWRTELGGAVPFSLQSCVEILSHNSLCTIPLHFPHAAISFCRGCDSFSEGQAGFWQSL